MAACNGCPECILLLRQFEMKLDEAGEDGYEIKLDGVQEDKDPSNRYTIGIPRRIENMTNFIYTRSHLLLENWNTTR